MRRWLLLLSLGLALLLLAACSARSELHFVNETECGAATITLMHIPPGQTSTHTIAPGAELTIAVTPDELYRYEVTYPRDAATQLQCEPKLVETRVRRGQRITITLESIRPEG